MLINYTVGVDINFKDEDGWSALHHAAGEGHIKIVKWLVDSCEGIDVDVVALDNCTPLWFACYNNKRDVVEHLLLVGSDDTIRGNLSYFSHFALKNHLYCVIC